MGVALVSQAKAEARARAVESPPRAAAARVTFDERKISADQSQRAAEREEKRPPRQATPEKKEPAPQGQTDRERSREKEKEKGKLEEPRKEKNKKYWEKVRERRKEKKKSQEPNTPSQDGSGGQPEEEEVNWDSYLSSWLSSYPADHLSAAQSGCHLLIQMYKSSGELSEYMDRCLHGHPPEGEERVRNLLPLPFWPDVLDEMRSIVSDESYTGSGLKQRGDGPGRSRNSRNLRLTGLLAWHGLVVLSLNFNSEGCKGSGRIPLRGGKASPLQEAALDRIWVAVRRFVDQKESGKGLGVPRTPQVEWAQELEQLKVELHRRSCQKSRPLTLEQILPGLPKAEHGAIVPLEQLCSGEVREKILNHAVCLRMRFVRSCLTLKSLQLRENGRRL